MSVTGSGHMIENARAVPRSRAGSDWIEGRGYKKDPVDLDRSHFDNG